MADTEENQEVYPQPSTQKAGGGFPVMKLVGVFCLQCGALLGWAQGTLLEQECRRFRRRIEFLVHGDIVLADRGFSGFGPLASLKQRGVHSVMRIHPRRKRIRRFYQTVATDPLIFRPERSEARAIKRRPKNYRLMTKPRHEMVVEPNRKYSQKPSKKALQ